MRKKYLSALLFGALLLASAGTFTSCSDYDDDIKNLQEQINTVVSDLESLKTKVDGLGGYVTDVKVENGKLVVTANGSTVSYDLPAGGSSEVANIEIKDGHLYVNGTDKGSVGSTVTVNEEGQLVIDGEVSDLKVGTEVIIKDASNGIYTISIDGQTIQLPMASAAITSLEVFGGNKEGDYYLFTEKYTAAPTQTANGIYWGKASADLKDWTGTLGSISKDQLLIGGVSVLNVSVTPATYDLSKSKLTLVDTKGNEAPATLTLYAAGNDNIANSGSGSRAVDLKGEWAISLTLTADADKMGSAYATADGQANALYALAVDGKVMTPYNIVVDTRTNTQVATHAKAEVIDLANNTNKLFIGDKTTTSSSNLGISNVALGENKIVYKDAKVADVQVDIAKESIDDAELFGITLDKKTNVLTVSDKAAGNATLNNKIKLNVTLLETNGKVGKTVTYTIESFATTVVDDKVTLASTPYTVVTTGSKDVIINLEETFSGLTAEQATSLAYGNGNAAVWTSSDNKFLVEGTKSGEVYNIGNITYYASEADAKKGESNILLNDESKGRVRNIKYARISVKAYNRAAEVGTRNLTLTLNTAQGEIKKVTVPVEVTLPKFDDLFKKTTKWVDGKLALRLIASAKDQAAINFNQAFEVANTSLSLNDIVYTINDVNNKAVQDGNSSNGTVELNEANIKANDGTLAVKEITANAFYTIAGVTKFVVKSSFNTTIKSMFEDATIVYYKDNAVVDLAEVVENNGANVIKGLTGNGSNDSKYNGLAVKFGKEFKALSNGAVVDGVKIVDATAADQQVSVSEGVTGLSGIKPIRVTADGTYTLEGTLKTGDSATLVVTFTDCSGFKTTASIKFQK